MFHVKHLSFEVSKYQNRLSEMFHVQQNHTFFKSKTLNVSRGTILLFQTLDQIMFHVEHN